MTTPVRDQTRACDNVESWAAQFILTARSSVSRPKMFRGPELNRDRLRQAGLTVGSLARLQAFESP